MKRLWDASKSNAMYEEYYYMAVGDIGVDLEEKGDLKHARSDLLRALTGFESLYKADPSDVRVQEEIGKLEKYLGLVLAARGQVADGKVRLRKALGTFQQLSQQDPSKGDHYLPNIADVYQAMGRANSVAAAQTRLPHERRIALNNEACSAYQKSIAAWEQLRGLRQLSRSETKEMQQAGVAATKCGAH